MRSSNPRPRRERPIMKWKLVPVEPDDTMVYAACDASNLFRVDFVRAFEAAIEEAPTPPKLSDDRIREIWIEHGLDDEDVEGFARAIEREILGGGHE